MNGTIKVTVIICLTVLLVTLSIIGGGVLQGSLQRNHYEKKWALRVIEIKFQKEMKNETD